MIYPFPESESFECFGDGEDRCETPRANITLVKYQSIQWCRIGSSGKDFVKIFTNIEAGKSEIAERWMTKDNSIPPQLKLSSFLSVRVKNNLMP